MILSPKENAKIYGPKHRTISQLARAKRLARTLCTAKQRPPTIEGWIEWAAYRIDRAWNASRRAARKERN